MDGSLLATRGFLILTLSPNTDSATQTGYFTIVQSTHKLMQNRAASRLNYTPTHLQKLNNWWRLINTCARVNARNYCQGLRHKGRMRVFCVILII